MNVTINLPEDIRVSRLGVDIDIRLADIPPAILSRLIEHGLSQKIGDATAGAVKDAGFESAKYADLSEVEKAKVDAHALTAMTAVLDQLKAGTWATKRAAGAAVDPIVAAIRSLMRSDVKKAMGSDWPKDDEAAIAEILDEQFAAQSAEYRAAIEELAMERIAAAERERKMKAGLRVAVKR